MNGSDLYNSALIETKKSKPDMVLVLKYLDSAANGGDERAIYARASCYCDGKYGSVIDERLAFVLFKKLEKSDVAEGLFALAYIYDLGEGVKADKLKAFSLYMRAALLGHSEANSQISEFYREGKDVNRDSKLAAAWKQRAKSDELKIAPPWRTWLV